MSLRGQSQAIQCNGCSRSLRTRDSAVQRATIRDIDVELNDVQSGGYAGEIGVAFVVFGSPDEGGPAEVVVGTIEWFSVTPVRQIVADCGQHVALGSVHFGIESKQEKCLDIDDPKPCVVTREVDPTIPSAAVAAVRKAG